MISENDLLELMVITDVIHYYGEDDLLEEMGYDPTYCFENKDAFLLEAEYELKGEPDIELETMNEKDIYNRFLEVFSKDKLSYQQWDEFLSKYE